jgi:carbonic anhydrase/acetyltransferase-like protein (isoleucine patch superfamily)
MLRPFRGRMPVVHPTAFVDDTAQIIGDVEIGAESSVWMNVVVRGDVHRIRIGDRSNVQDGTIVHAAVIHGCTIRDRVLVGIGAIVLNGAEIGEDSIVAAGTLVTERMIVPSRSLVMGRPGKVTRALTDEEVRTVLGYAERYVKYRLDYMGSDGESSKFEVRRSKPD